MHIRDAVRFARRVTTNDVIRLRSAYLENMDGVNEDDCESLLLPLRVALLKQNMAMSLVDVSSVYRVVCRKLQRLVSVQSVVLKDRWSGLCGYVDNSVDNPTIVYNADLNLCWRRFTLVKELMHLYSGTVDNLRHPDFRRSPSFEIIDEASASRQISFSENVSLSDESAAMVMAIEVLIPWRLRAQLDVMIDMRAAEFSIAKAFMVPLSLLRIMLPSGYYQGAGGYYDVSKSLNAGVNEEMT